VLAFEASNHRFPIASEIVEALEISEADAAKGLAAMVKARKAGGAPPIQFSRAGVKHLYALKTALEKRFRRFEREREKQLREESKKHIDAMVGIRMGQEVSMLIRDRLAAHAKRKEAAFTVEKYKLLLKVAHPDNSASNEKRTQAAQLLNERAIFATGGQWGKGK